MTAAAACLDTPTSVFFPVGKSGKGAMSYEDLHAPAKAICARCPIRRQCLDEHRHERFGVWGGTTPEERGFRSGAGAGISASGTALVTQWVERSEGEWTSDDVYRGIERTVAMVTVRSHLATLRKAGTIEVVGERRTGPNGGGATKVYRRAEPMAAAA